LSLFFYMFVLALLLLSNAPNMLFLWHRLSPRILSLRFAQKLRPLDLMLCQALLPQFSMAAKGLFCCPDRFLPRFRHTAGDPRYTCFE
jgi:hypothetical protein